MKHGAFSLYVKSLKSGREWYARYWNQAERRYGKVRATGVKVHGKRGRRDMALKAAWDMCDDIAANGGKQTVLQFFAKIWQEDSLYVKEFRLYDKPLSSSWLRNHAAMLNAHLKTYEPFKNLMLCDAEKNDILRYMLWLKDNGRSNGLINHIITNLRPGFDYAAENKLITANPCNGIKSLKEVRKEKGILTREEVAQALAELKGNELTFFALGACCGLRIGEIQGLLWCDVEDDRISITRQLQYGGEVKAPKYGSAGVIPISQRTREALGQRGQGYVLNHHKGKPYTASAARKLFYKSMARLGIDCKARNITPHSLRHTFITQGQAGGITPMEMAALARHKSIKMTANYTHPSQSLDMEKAREGIASAIG